LIESHTTRRFREAYAKLPQETRQQARQAFALFQANPYHPSLRFKKIDDATNTYSVRIGLGYRALGVLEGSGIIWDWIGSHADCDRLT
jgi:mRNA-degrading endonuclease RelE of RelBE toxin-antitoxin system